MLDQFMTTVIAIFGVALIFALFFFIWVLWTVREALFKVFVAIRVAWKKTTKDAYTRDEMINAIRYFEKHNNTKTANYWRREIIRKYPDEPFIH
jgi:hypothetical protein